MKAFMLCIVASALCAGETRPPVRAATEGYRALVLVRTFTSPGLPGHRGELAAEALAAALEARGLTRALRPRKITVDEDGLALDTIKIDDLERADDKAWQGGRVDTYWGVVRRKRRKEIALPSDYVVTGAVSRLGDLWWIRASLLKRGSRRKVCAAEGKGRGDEGFFKAIDNVAAGIEEGYRREAIERRSEEILRQVRLGRISGEGAAERLDALHARWPDVLSPVAVRLLLLSEEDKPDPAALAGWAEKTVALLGSGDAGEVRFVVRLGLDPYAILAGRCEATGRLDEAAQAHRQAAETFPLGRFQHLVALARIEEVRGRPEEAARACREALKLRPGEDSLRRRLERLLKAESGDR